jgi:hypothetical protein
LGRVPGPINDAHDATEQGNQVLMLAREVATTLAFYAPDPAARS